MSRIKWYKRDPLAALDGMMILTLEERGAYNTVLDLIYAREGKVADDDRFLAGWMRCDIRVWKRIKERLISLGKLQTSDGLLTNLRATSEVSAALHASEAGRDHANRMWADRRGNKDLADGTPDGTPDGNNTQSKSKNQKERKKDGAEAPLLALVDPPQNPTPEKLYFDRVRQIFGPKAGGLGKRILLAHGNNVALAHALIEQASTKSQPSEYIGGALKRVANAHTNGTTADNPWHPSV